MDAAIKYSQAAVTTLEPYEVESGALIKSASHLNAIKQDWGSKQGELIDALDRNRMLWVVISSAMQESDCPQPLEIRNNIVNLALFIFQRTITLLSEPKPEGLDILIDINMNIAKGLVEGQQNKGKQVAEQQ